MTSRDAILALVREGRWRQARVLALAALAQPDVDRAHLHALIGRLSVQLEDREQAGAHLDAAVDRGIDDPGVWQLLADLVDRPARRRQLLVRAASHPRGSGAAALALAADSEAAGNAEEALNWWNRAAAFPATAQAALARLAVVAAQLGRWSDGLRALEQLRAIQPTAEALADAVRALLPAPMASDELDKAIDDLQAAGLMGSAAAQWRALRQVAVRKPDKAVRHAQQAVQLGGAADADAARLLGECLLLDGQREQAIEVLEPLALQGHLPETTALALADAQRQLGRLTDALPVVDAVVRTSPGHAGALIELSRIYADLGREAEAEQAIRQAMALDARVDQEAGRSSQVLRGVLAELPAVLQRLGAGNGWQVARLRMGHNALLCQVEQTTGATLYAKVFLPGRRTQDHAESTAQLEAALAQDPELAEHVGVPGPLVDGQGRAAQPCAGGFAVVAPAIAGRSLRRTLAHPRQGLTIENAEQLGRALLRVHQGFERMHKKASSQQAWQRPPAGLTSAVLPLLRWLEEERAWPQTRAKLGLYDGGEALGDALQEHLELWLPQLADAVDVLPQGVIHGDFGWHNANWLAMDSAPIAGSGDGNVQHPVTVVGVVDFDYAAWDVPLADLAQAIARSAADWKRLTHHRDPAPRPEIAAALVRGYTDLGGPLPLGQPGLRALLVGTRIAYGFALAEAGLQRDVRAPSGYGPTLDALTLLNLQLDWLREGAAVLLPD